MIKHVLTTDSMLRAKLSRQMLTLALGFSFALVAGSPTKTLAHDYVGESACEDCHDSQHEALANIIGPNGGKADPVSVWKQDPHHSAYTALSSPWGKQAASRVNLADPTADGAMCLKCHVTGAGSSSAPDPSDGVSCEACHGPAADWQGRSQHGEIDDSAAQMQAAVALGLIDLRKMDIREQQCRTCHVKDVSQRPCYRSSEEPFSVNNDQKFRHWRNNIPPL